MTVDSLLYLTFVLQLMGSVGAQKACVASPGTYCPLATGDAVPCPAGQYCPGTSSSSNLVPCPVGTFLSTTGAVSSAACQACPINTVSSSPGQSLCLPCAAGSVYASPSSCSVCPGGTYAAQGDSTCTPCAAGTSSANGAPTCSACKPGTYASASNSGACTACPPGTYTFTSGGAGGASLIPVWGATSSSQCGVMINATFSPPLICLPGTRMVGAGCLPCPLGYYCPLISQSANAVGEVRTCPLGTSPISPGAGLSTLDCVVSSMLMPLQFAECGITPSDQPLLDPLLITAVTASLDANTVFFTTSTAVYRMFLQTNTLELLAGQEGVSGPSVNSAVGANARFSQLTAIGVDLDAADASVVVVGDGPSVRMIDVFSRKVTLLGAVGDIQLAGGIALRRKSGQRFAYVSDSVSHRIQSFSLDTLQRSLVAGSVDGNSPGYTDGYFGSARFSSPMGVAFLERAMNQSRILLVADFGNAVIRAVDVDSHIVSTWFAPLDLVSPELTQPVGLSVSTLGGATIVYTADKGLQRVGAIQPTSSDPNSKIFTPLQALSPMTDKHFVAVLPYGTPVFGSATTVAYTSLLVLDGTSQKLHSLVQDIVANSANGGGAVATCHLPCQEANCGALTPAALCGNSFLDPGEQCDDPFPGSGCSPTACTILPGFACPSPLGGGAVPPTTCLQPCAAYTYAFTGVAYCSADCAGLTPRQGYTINDQCVETDIDECAANLDDCSMSAMCINTPGSYQCQCFSGYFGDGLNCTSLAYAVYTIVDVPAVMPSALSVHNAITTALMQGVETAYASTLAAAIPSSMLSSSLSFHTKNAAQLALQFTTYSLDPSKTAFTRMELVSLFETEDLAGIVASTVSMPAIATAVSNAFFGTGTGATVFQAPMVRQHQAAGSFSSPAFVDGWGMNITSVVYNRSCALQNPVHGFSIPPPGGCWMVEMIYMGGPALPKSDENPNAIQQSKNVLYLPRIERDASSGAPLAPAQTLTMSSGIAFPCDVSGVSAAGAGILPPATACCLRDVEAAYRPNRAFSSFLQTANYASSAPASVCADPSRMNDTFPRSDVVFDLIMSPDDNTNDLVTGQIEGMFSSEVRLLETIDYTTRTFRVLLMLEEGDLRNHASMFDGVPGLSYNMTFFVGLANFKGTGGAVMNTRNAQQYITVTKSNSLTISTYGANQDPLVSSVDMQLVRIKVTDFFNPVQYLYYLKPVFTLPSNFQSPPSGDSMVPLNSIRVEKLVRGVATGAAWVPVCFAANGNYMYANPALVSLVNHAQSETCVQSDLQMCYPPLSATSVVTFGVPLAPGFITDQDFAAAATTPSSLQLQFVVQAFDIKAQALVLNTISMSVQITALGYTALCETASASQNLADIISGNIYIGTATTDSEWKSIMQKKENIDVPGSQPSNSLEFQTVTVQGAAMTFAALGNPAYFEDPRYQGQSVQMNEIFTIHFLEPLSGVSGDPTPNFNAVKALFLAGGAFSTQTDAVTHAMWLVPTPALLAICPFRPTIGHLACITRVDSTFKNNVLTRLATDVSELRMNDNSSVVELQVLMANMLQQGSVNDYANQLGSGFYSELSSQLNLNNRYRKAYVVNPVMNWQLDAIQNTQPGKSSFTVSTKIIGIGMITIHSADGTQLARRLLFSSMSYEGNDDVLDIPINPPKQNNGRRLLQSLLSPSMSQTSNSLVMDLNIPDKTAVTQLCPVIGATVENCRGLQYAMQVKNADAVAAICAAQASGSLGAILDSGMRTAFMGDTNFASNVTQTLLMDFSVSGCPSSSILVAAGNSNNRALKQTTGEELVIVISNVLLAVSGGNTMVKTSRVAQYISFFQNATIMQQLLGGAANLQLQPLYSAPPAGNYNGTYNGTVTIIWHNVNKTNMNNSDITNYLNQENPPPPGVNNNDMFQSDSSDYRSLNGVLRSSSAVRESAMIMLLNTLLALACLSSIMMGGD